MSIVPITNQQGTISRPFSFDNWDPFKNFLEEFPLALDIFDPFIDFPSFSREFSPWFGTQTQSQIKWKETPRAHVFKAFLPGLSGDQVVVFIDDDRMLQISSEDGNFMTRYKLPENARTEEVKASMEHGVLTVTIAKEQASRPSVRVVDITGE